MFARMGATRQEAKLATGMPPLLDHITPPIGLGIGGAPREVAVVWQRSEVRLAARRLRIGWQLDLTTGQGTRQFLVNIAGHARELAAAV